jgi:hypothetical protein
MKLESVTTVFLLKRNIKTFQIKQIKTCNQDLKKFWKSTGARKLMIV